MHTMIDNHVGSRIRERRIMLGLTPQQLADATGVACETAQKYEQGTGSVSAGRLFEIARVLGVPVGYFYEGLGGATGRPETARDRMTLETARDFAAIADELHQQAVGALARVLAEID